MPSAADLRTAITAANTGVAHAAQQILLADAADTLLPDPVTVSKYFVLFAWLDGSRRWQAGYEPYDSLDLANGAAAIKQASADYANVTVSAPIRQTSQSIALRRFAEAFFTRIHVQPQ
jgi:hypothetical protein